MTPGSGTPGHQTHFPALPLAAFFTFTSFLRLGLHCAKQEPEYLTFPTSITRQNRAPNFCFQVQTSQGRDDWLRLGQVRIPEPINSCQGDGFCYKPRGASSLSLDQWPRSEEEEEALRVQLPTETHR